MATFHTIESHCVAAIKDNHGGNPWLSLACGLCTHLSKLIVGAIVLLDVVLFEPHDGVCVVHPPERPLGGFEVLRN